MTGFVIQICKGCGNEFKTGAWEVKRGVKYCCRDCYNETKLRRRLDVEIAARVAGEA
jgi:hypothetical protein